MARLILNNDQELQILKSAFDTLLSEVDLQSRFAHELEIKALFAMFGCAVVDSVEPHLEMTATDPTCCGCGACPVKLPIERFFE
jgi:hypothetical protein